MKQLGKLSLLLLLPLLMSATGCTEGELTNGTMCIVNEELHEVNVTFNIGTRFGLQSRADRTFNRITDGVSFIPDGSLIPKAKPPRQLISSNNWQQVNDVRIYVFKKNDMGQFVYHCPLDNNGQKRNYFAVDAFTEKFNESPYAVWYGGNEKLNETHTYNIRPMLEDGTYRFLAIGRDDKNTEPFLTDPNTVNEEFEWSEWEEDITTLDEVTLMCTNRNVVASTELFSGCSDEPGISVTNENTSFQQSIELKRSTAGLLLYIENIPARIKENVPPPIGIVLREGPTVAVGLIHGQTLSDKVKLHDRSALPGTLNTVQNKEVKHSLLRIDIPEDAQIQDGYYVNLSPQNGSHPHSLLGGVFAMPQLPNQEEGDDNDLNSLQKSLYLVIYGESTYTDGSKEEFSHIIPVRLAASTPAANYDPYYYPINANEFYSLGKRRFSDDGSNLEEDEPIDLKKHFDDNTEIIIRIDPFWNEYYGGNIGDAYPGIGLDPEWGEHPSGELE